MRLINAYPIEAGIANYLATNAYLNDTAQDALEMVGKWVNEAPTVELPRWIPVEECLPETIPCAASTACSEAVIVRTSGKKTALAVWNGECFICVSTLWEIKNETLTHWMPLPTPPKESTAYG